MKAALRLQLSLPVVALVLSAAGCSSSSTSPSSPSTSSGGATIEATMLVSPDSPASPSPSAGKKIEFGGTVESITPPSITVAGRSVVTNADTRIKRSGQAITLSDITVGMKVEVEGVVQSDGSVLASKVKVEDEENDEDENEQEVEFKGTIESITAPSLTVSGQKVMTNGSTRIRREDKTVALADLKVGEKVEVEGTRQADGSVLAGKIKVEDGDNDERDDGDDN
jgi:hypothetical protein